MRILVISGDNDLHNSGDNAMLQVTVRWLKELFPGLELSIVTRSPKRLIAMIPDSLPVRIGAPPGLPSGLADILRQIPTIRYCVRSRRYRSWTRQVRTAIDNSDAVVLSGQGIMTDAFVDEAVWRLALLETAHKLGKVTALFSQGLGIVTNPQLSFVMKRVLPQMDLIALRNRKDANRIRVQFGCQPNQIGLGGDDGLAYPTRVVRTVTSTAIGISIRVADYAGVRVQSDRRWLALVQILQDSAAELGAHMLPVPIEVGDLRCIEESFGLTPERADGSLELDELVRSVAACRVVITGSYHSAVFALALGIPAICLVFSDYYAAKFEGLVDRYLDGCMLFDVRTTPPAVLQDRLRLAWDQAPSLAPMLTAVTEDLIMQNRTNYQRFVELLPG